MKISELLKQLEAARTQCGDLDVVLILYTEGRFDREKYIVSGDLHRLQAEEGGTMKLISDDAETQGWVGDENST